MRPDLFGKRVEVHRLVRVFQKLVMDVVVLFHQDGINLLTHHLVIGLVRQKAPHRPQHLLSLFQALVLRGLRGVKDHQLAERFGQIPAWQDIQAQVDQTPRIQHPLTERKDRRPNTFRHPREHSVADHVVEPPQVLTHPGDVPRQEPHVRQPERTGVPLRLLNLIGREIDPHETRLGHGHGQRQHVPSAGAADLQHAAAGRVWGLNPEQTRHAGHMIRMRFQMSPAPVRHVVVAAPGVLLIPRRRLARGTRRVHAVHPLCVPFHRKPNR